MTSDGTGAAARAAIGGGRASAAWAERGLDGLNLFVANIQTGFGPFVAVYLTAQGWTQTRIGLALSLGTVAAMASQLPAGALVDAMRSKAAVAGASILAFTASALLFALWPVPLFVYLAEVLHGFSSCTLGPAIATLSLMIAGQRRLGVRLGRNARFAAIGNATGAALMGACGYYLSNRAVFFLTAALTLGALLPLVPLVRLDAPQWVAPRNRAKPPARLSQVLTDRRLVIFALCAMVFTLGNAAIMPIAANLLTKRWAETATLLIAAGVVLPQLVVAALSPAFGRLVESHGRRLVLVLGLCSLPIRGILFAAVPDPVAMVLYQALDGVAGAALGIMTPLVTSDVAARSGHYNLSLATVGFTIGIGATFSTTLAGWIADSFGDAVAFLSLAAVGLAATLLALFLMPETRPQ